MTYCILFLLKARTLSPQNTRAFPQSTHTFLPKARTPFSSKHTHLSPQSTHTFLPKARTPFSPKHACIGIRHPSVMARPDREWRCVLLWRLRRLTDRGVPTYIPRRAVVGSTETSDAEGLETAGTGVRHTTWRDCRRRAGLTKRRTRRTIITQSGQPTQSCVVTQVPCVAGMRYLWRELRISTKCGSITPTIVWWADVCPRGSGAARAVSGQRGSACLPTSHAVACPQRVIITSCLAALQGRTL